MTTLNFSEWIAAFIAWFIAAYSFDLLFKVELAFIFLWFLVTLFLTEHKKNPEHWDKLTIQEVAWFIVSKENTVKSYIIFSAVIGASTLTFSWISQPLWKQQGLEIQYFWIVWGILNLLVWVSSMYAHRLEKRFSLQQIIIFFWLCSFVFYIVLYFTHNIYLILILSSFFWIFRWLNWPILKDYINKQTSSRMRATVMSVKNLAFRIVFSIVSPFIWYLADLYTIHVALLLSWFIFAILAWIAMIWMLFSRD